MFGLQPKPLLHIEGAIVLLLSCILYHQFHGNWLLFVRKRLTNPTYQFAVDFAEVGG